MVVAILFYCCYYLMTDKSLIQRHGEEEGVVSAATDWSKGCKCKFKPGRLQLLRLALASRSSNLFQILTKNGVNGVFYFRYTKA